MRAMVFSLATLGVVSLHLVNTLALPPMRIPSASGLDLTDRSTSPSANRINSVLSLVPLNLSITTPTPSNVPINAWAVQCDRDTIPPGWTSPPEFHKIGDIVDCHRAVYDVTRGGDPLEPQTWTTKSSWSQPSCGVFLVPGSNLARVHFARIDLAEVAYEILRDCFRPGHGLIGGWAAIGGQFIVLLTGR